MSGVQQRRPSPFLHDAGIYHPYPVRHIPLPQSDWFDVWYFVIRILFIFMCLAMIGFCLMTGSDNFITHITLSNLFDLFMNVLTT